MMARGLGGTMEGSKVLRERMEDAKGLWETAKGSEIVDGAGHRQVLEHNKNKGASESGDALLRGIGSPHFSPRDAALLMRLRHKPASSRGGEGLRNTSGRGPPGINQRNPNPSMLRW
jgi:hypothetical protein